MKEERIERLLRSVENLSRRSPAPSAEGPTVMRQLAEAAEAETEDAAMARKQMIDLGMKYREAYSRIHMRSPFADCKVIG